MVRGRIILYWSQTPLKLSGPLKWSGRCRARVAQTARNCHRQRDKTARGVLAPLTNVLGRKRPRSLLPSSSDSDVNSDGDEDIQPVGARVGHRYLLDQSTSWLEFQVQPWRTRRRAAALTSRGNPSRGFSGDLGVSTCASTPPERVLLDLSQHLSTSRAHRDRLRCRSRTRLAENSREGR